MIGTDRKIEVSEAVIAAELDDESVLLNVETGMYFGLDPVGTRIWQLLEGGSTQSEILDTLLNEYDVEPDRVGTDVEVFLDILEAKGLVCSEH